MFVGHFAVGFALRSAYPKANLGLMFASVEAIDLLHGGLTIAGVESAEIASDGVATHPYDLSYPYIHSVIGALVFSAHIVDLYWLYVRR